MHILIKHLRWMMVLIHRGEIYSARSLCLKDSIGSVLCISDDESDTEPEVTEGVIEHNDEAPHHCGRKPK